MGMVMLKYLPMSLVDNVIVNYAKMKFGNLAKFGIPQPQEGHFMLRSQKVPPQ